MTTTKTPERTPTAAHSKLEDHPEIAIPARESRWTRLRQRPITWLVLMPLILLIEGLFLGPADGASRPVAVAFTAASGVAAWLAYRLIMGRVARRPMPELARPGAARELMLGAGVGAGFILASVGVIAASGGYHLHAGTSNVLPVLISTVVAALAGAAAEEFAFRGVALQALEKIGGSWFAVAITAFLFGFAHLFNPDATVWSSVAIAIEAGVLVGVAFLWRRNLWFVIGLHAAWNAVEGLFGIPVSGHVDPALATTSVHGSTLLTGGSFGLEASLVPVLISLVIAAPMVVAARRSGGIRRRG